MTTPSASPNLDAIIRAYLAGSPSPTTPAAQPGYAGDLLPALVAGRIYAGTEFPEGYRPTLDGSSSAPTGPGILIATRGPVRQAPPIYEPVIEVRSYGPDERTARRVEAAVFAHLEGAMTRSIRRAWRTAHGQLRKEPEPRLWPYVLTTYEAIIAVR